MYPSLGQQKKISKRISLVDKDDGFMDLFVPFAKKSSFEVWFLLERKDSLLSDFFSWDIEYWWWGAIGEDGLEYWGYFWIIVVEAWG